MTAAAAKTEDLVEGVLARRPRAVARMISIAESRRADQRGYLAEIYAHAGRAHVVGITGVPGSGKSTLVRALAKAFRDRGKTVGIVAVDPSSPFSGGAILGDRVRMGDLATDDGVFIRSLATRGALGGLARACLDTVDILDAAGFDVVLIETVGVGQDEVDIAEAAHSVVVVSAPGLGDGVQAIKAGVLEIADIHVVSKCDKPESGETVADLKAMLNLGLKGRERFGWQVPVLPTSAETGSGIDDLADQVAAHREHLDGSGELEHRHRKITEMRILKTAEDLVRENLQGQRDGHLKTLLDRAVERDVDPGSAARELIRSLKIDG